MIDATPLPPVDEIRQPLVRPLGHLVLHAAWFDNALIEFITFLLPFGRDTTATQVAHELRNWNDKFVRQAVASAVEDFDLVSDLNKFIDRVSLLRERRHRMVHDAMEVGIEGNESVGYHAVLLREGYQRLGKGQTELRVNWVTPAELAEIAWEYYNLGVEIDTFFGRMAHAD